MNSDEKYPAYPAPPDRSPAPPEFDLWTGPPPNAATDAPRSGGAREDAAAVTDPARAPGPAEDTGAANPSPDRVPPADVPMTDFPERGITAAQTFARLLRLEEFVRDLVPSQNRRSERIERRINGLEEALLNQIAEIETGCQAAIASAGARLTDRLAAAASAIEGAEAARADAEKRAVEAEAQAKSSRTHHDAYRLAWQAAPLGLRLRFVRELLPEDHAAQTVLKEAAALEDLRRRGQDLETWLTTYPSLFADAAQSLYTGDGATGAPPDAEAENPVEILAAQTVNDARAALEGTLQALGLTWIAPLPGDAVLAEHEVIGEEPSPRGEGRIATLRRRGFRIRGRLAVAAQVVRAVAPARAPAQSVYVEPVAVAEPDGTTDRAIQTATHEAPAGETMALWWKTAPSLDGPPPTPPGEVAEPAKTTDEGAEGKEAALESGGTTESDVNATTAAPDRTGQPPQSHDNAPTGDDSAGGPQRPHSPQRPLSPAQDEAAPGGDTISGAAAGSGQPAQDPSSVAEAKDLPDWVRMLGQRTFGCDLPAVTALAGRIQALTGLPARIAGDVAEDEASALLTGAIAPLLPLLGLRYAGGLEGVPETWGAVFLEVREPLLAWLEEKLDLRAVLPARGERFDPETMEAVETRRTVHANENETVSKVERAGLLWRGRPLLRAEVVRYASEGTS